MAKVTKLQWVDHYILVAAIDIGTSNSGYAFSFKTDQDDIRMNKNWGEKQSCVSYKTPTCVLTESGPNGKYVNFGYEAETLYIDSLVGPDVCKFDLYHNFKMVLYTEQNLNSRTMGTSSRGTKRPLMDIFTMIIKALKDHLLEAIQKAVPGQLQDNDIRWVVTVPAIWSHKAKEFMEKASKKAGLHPLHTLLSLEPEAASLHCRASEINNFVKATDLYFETHDIAFPPGTKYLLIDAGGGTVDFTAHEILAGGDIRELYAATGGDWGGCKVNDNFTQLLENVMGKTFIEKYKRECPQHWYELLLKFESKKRSAVPKKGTLNIELSATLDKKYRKWENKELDDSIKSKQSLGVSESNGYLVLNLETVTNLFQPTIDQIISHINRIMTSEKVKEVKFEYLFLVGGFSDSKYLQTAVQEYFKGKQPVLIPTEAQIAIIKGAVRFGHNPSVIKVRKAQCTYGISTMVKFDEKIHQKVKVAKCDGITFCKDVFLPFVLQGEDIEINTVGKTLVTPAFPSASNVSLSFHTLQRKPKPNEVLYIDSPGVERVGTINVPIPSAPEGKERLAELEIMFGGTVIHAKAHDHNSGKISMAEIQFMTC